MVHIGSNDHKGHIEDKNAEDSAYCSLDQTFNVKRGLDEAVGGADKPTYSIYRWDARRDRIRRSKQGLPASEVVAISPDGKQVVLGSGQSALFTRLR